VRVLTSALAAVLLCAGSLPVRAASLYSGDWPDSVQFTPSITVNFDSAQDQNPIYALGSTASLPGLVTFTNATVYNYWTSLLGSVGSTQAPDGSTTPGRGVLIGSTATTPLEISLAAGFTAIALHVAEVNSTGFNLFTGTANVQLFGAGWQPLPDAQIILGPNPTFLAAASDVDIRGVRIYSNATGTRPVIDNFSAGQWAAGPLEPLPGEPPVGVPEPLHTGLAGAALLLLIKKFHSAQ
jgi:hypothetical protein